MGFNLIRIIKKKKKKTAFRYKYNLFKYNIIPLSFINMPAIFQIIINNIFQNLINIGLLIYLNNLLIYTNILKKYNKLIKKIFYYLFNNNLAIAF